MLSASILLCSSSISKSDFNCTLAIVFVQLDTALSSTHAELQRGTHLDNPMNDLNLEVYILTEMNRISVLDDLFNFPNISLVIDIFEL